MAGLVLLCVLAQALLLPAQRTSERLHFHLGGAAATALANLPPTPPTFASVVFTHRQAVDLGEVPHAHWGLQDHEHGRLAGVVYVSDDSGPLHGSQGGQGVNKRLLLDQDGLSSSFAPWLLLTAARVGFIKSTLRLHTRSEPPLERPPRPRS